jgi:hypothetical protein
VFAGETLKKRSRTFRTIVNAGIISCGRTGMNFISSNYKRPTFAVKSEKRRLFREVLKPCNKK